MSYIYVLAIFLFLTFQQSSSVVIYLAGDSTMAEKKEEKRPETGWGEKLSNYFTKDVIIKNYARNGRSTRTFIEEGRWDSLRQNVNRGDYIFIQFGHNDQSKKKVKRYTPPEQFKTNLKKFITDVRDKNAIPVLFTPIVRRRFDKAHKFYDVHGIYPDLTREVAKQYNVTLIDMHKATKELLINLGEEKSKQIFLILESGKSINYPNGINDNTHLNDYGASIIAQLAVELLNNSGLELNKYLKNEN